MRLIITTLLILSIFTFSCNIEDTVDKLTTFDISNQVEFTIPSSAGINLPLDFETPDVQSNSQQSFENNNTNAERVENVSLQELDLQITAPAGNTFQFLRSIEVYISNESQGRTLLAEAQNIPEDIGNVISLETTGENLDEYLKEASYDLEYETVLRETNNQDTDIRATMVFEVRAKLLN